VKVEVRKAVAWRNMDGADADLRLYADCFARNETPRDLDQLRWLHVENPTGRHLVQLAVAPDSGNVAGIYAVAPVWARAAGRRVVACQSLDTLTDVEYRGQGLFVRMARASYEQAAAQGYGFIYGFPNGSSAHGFFEKLNWTNLDPLPFLVRPLRTGLVSRRLIPSADFIPDLPLPCAEPSLRRDQEFRSVGRFGPAHEQVWRAFATGVGAAIERDASYLNWRLRDKPGHSYRVVNLLEGGNLLGFVAFAVSDKHGGRVGYVMELVHRPERLDAAILLARYAVRAMASDRADLVFAWCLPHSPNRAAYTKASFVPFPEKLRPVELHFGACSFSAECEIVRERNEWYISYLDSDTV
jgi:hypothetical protein